MRNLQKVYVLIVSKYTQVFSQVSRDILPGYLPATSTIHVYLRAKGTPFYYIRPLEVLIVCLIPTVRSPRVSWMRAQVDALCALNIVLPAVWSRMFGVPAVLESGIWLVHRPSIHRYKCGPPCATELAPSERATTKTIALTDNQRRAIPHAVLIDVVIPQQRSAYELQVRVHKILPELENLGALYWAVLRQGHLIH